MALVKCERMKEIADIPEAAVNPAIRLHRKKFLNL
jgi:hypothetical protein